MIIPGLAGQQARHFLYDAGGTITSGGTPQLLLAESKSRSYLCIQNISDTVMFVQFGAGFATATLTNGAVTSVSITNAGFGFTYAPDVAFLGGGPLKPDGRTPNLTVVAIGQPGYDPPDNVAQGLVTISGGAITGVTVTNPGSGYLVAPYVHITNSLRDPAGAAIPSATSGYELTVGGGALIFEGSMCPTSPVSIFCATTSKAFTCKYMT